MPIVEKMTGDVLFAPTPRKSAVLTSGVVALGALFMLSLARGWGGERATLMLSDLGLVAAATLAAVLCASAAARRQGRARLGWLLMSAATLMWATGEALWSYFEIGTARDVPFPSLADVAYLAAVPLAVGAMLAFVSGAPPRTSRVRMVLDGIAIAGALLLVSWLTVLKALVTGGGETLLEQAISIAYPAGDVVILTAVLWVVARSSREQRLAVGVLGLGLAAIAIADSGYTYLTLSDAYSSGAMIDGVWFIGYLLIGLSAVLSKTESARQHEPRYTRAGAVIPYAAVVFASIVVAVQWTTSRTLDVVTFWTTVAFVLLIVSRQFLARLDNVALNHALEERVKARTAELHFALQSAKMAQRSEEEFVSAVSHELRTPMTTIMGASSTLLRLGHLAGGDVEELAEMIGRAGTRMHELVEELLNVSRVTDDERSPMVTFDLAEVFTDVATRASLGTRSLVVSVARPLVAQGDPESTAVILSSLLSNAAKFAPEGSTVFVEASELPTPSIVVRDEGPGVPAEFRDRIFERFFQVDGSRTRNHGGIGAGLFLARQLASKMSATVELEHTETGAAFRLTFGAREAAHDLPVAAATV